MYTRWYGIDWVQVTLCERLYLGDRDAISPRARLEFPLDLLLRALASASVNRQDSNTSHRHHGAWKDEDSSYCLPWIADVVHE